MGYTFMKHVLGADESTWLASAAQSQVFDPRLARVRLRGKIADDFDPEKIDRRFYANDRPTLLGLWHANPKDRLFSNIDTVASAIKDRIIASPDAVVTEVKTSEIAGATGLSDADAGRALHALGQILHFWSSARGGSLPDTIESFTFGGEPAYREVLNYPGVLGLLERTYAAGVPVFPSPRLRTLRPRRGPSDSRAPLRSNKVRPNTAFLLMPMDPGKPELIDVHAEAKEAFRRFGIQAVRVDELEPPRTITDAILREIETRQHIFADLSHERPNVYYEIGYAHALGKNPILFGRDGTRIHFDLSVHKVSYYKNMTELRSMLERRLEEILGRTATPE